MNVYLVGFMGCGKSAVGKILADRLDLGFVDLDTLLVERLGVTISEYFSRFSEAEFRRQETRALKELSAMSGLVVATGGGAFCTTDNQTAIHSSGGTSVFLDVPWDVIKSRLHGPNTSRPKWQDPVQARALFIKRERWYRQAMITVKVTLSSSSEEVATAAEAALQGRVCDT